MEEFLHFLQGTMTKPAGFGWFHLMWIGIVVASCVLIYIFKKKISKKAINIILLVFGIALVVFEIYKQLVFSFNYNGGNGNSYWDFQWYAFPFQFCSTPMFVMILAGILRKGKVHDCLLCYLATFSLFGGLTVLVYTDQVFVSMIGINIQTMFWHSSLFVIGFLILATGSVKFSLKSVLKASAVFGVMLLIALLMNIIWHFCGNDETFNMFYISPYYPCTLIILDGIYEKAPYFVFLLVYVLGFMLIATIIMGIAIGLENLKKSYQIHKLPQDERTINKILDIIQNDF